MTRALPSRAALADATRQAEARYAFALAQLQAIASDGHAGHMWSKLAARWVDPREHAALSIQALGRGETE